MKIANKILRTGFIERACHWVLAFCFFEAACSGLSWFFPSLSWLSSVLGTPQLARVLHPFFGIAVFLLLTFMFIRFAKHNMFVATDRIWLRNAGDVLRNRHGKPLQIGKYNAGQKVLFWLIMALICALLLTGLVIWRAYFATFFPIPVVRLALLGHALAGVGLILLILGHIHLAIWVRGSITSMLTGHVSRTWARQHHDRWYEEVRLEQQSQDSRTKHQ
ncbi:formate dehydrogenase subunit gamma [Cupriavidus pauculus]|uniref:Formate dehydrogenase subunit gamma n=1 Tax=Cupriavidus pauculus TaxID=82633 RepID=A0A2N5C5C7_9BURK|nr:formate dehydrogenase subunit gamma [Cupriavidus pauculus]PLP97425.1 formate dehydrogenase subunit gamma [Cupriavidus pauculus]